MPGRKGPGIFFVAGVVAGTATVGLPNPGKRLKRLAFNATAIAKTLAETINTAAGIQHFLLAGVERVAG